LHDYVIEILDEFGKREILDAIDISESDMFSRISKILSDLLISDMNEVLNVLICNTMLE
jgi:hypothetical protein